MFVISHVVALSNNNVIGVDNDLPWSLKTDLSHFKKYTTNKIIIMGRKTFESIGKPLPNRKTVIITRDTSYHVEGCSIVNSLGEAIKRNTDKDLFIIGGAQIYTQVIEKKLADKLDITLVKEKFDADVFFPEINPLEWKITEREDFYADEKNPHDYSFLTFEKVSVS